MSMSNSSVIQNRPISNVLDGYNYILWSHRMTIHLKCLGLYSYVTRLTFPPVKGADETDIAFAKRSDDWDIKNARILGFINASTITKINQQYLDYSTPKEVWKFLSKRYITAGLSHQYHLWSAFQSKRQQPDQSISSYVSEMQVIREQLNLAAPQIFYDSAGKFHTYFNQLHFITMLMGLKDRFESVRASLLHRQPLPTSEDAFAELLSEETRIQPCLHISSDVVLHIPSSNLKSRSNKPKPMGKWNNNECSFCHSTSYLLLNCPVRYCRWCNIKHPRYYGSDCPKHPRNTTSQKQQFRSKLVAGTVMPNIHKSKSSWSDTINASTLNSDLMQLMRHNQEMMQQLMSGSLSTTDLSSSSGSKDQTDSWNRP